MKRRLIAVLLATTILILTGCGNKTVREAIGDKGQSGTEQVTKGDMETIDGTEAIVGREDDTEDAEKVTGADLTTDGFFQVDDRTDAETNKDGNQIIMNASYQYYLLSGKQKDGKVDVVAKINEAIQADLTQITEQAKSQRAAAWETYEQYVNYEANPSDKNKDFESYTLNYKCKLVRNDAAVLSICYRLDTFTQGKHGEYGYHCLNFDAQTGELLTINDLSEDCDAFSKVILDKVKELSEKEEYQKLFFEDHSGNLEEAALKDGAWALTEKGMEIIADPYVLGPYASGAIVFPIGYKELQGMKESYIYKQ